MKLGACFSAVALFFVLLGSCSAQRLALQGAGAPLPGALLHDWNEREPRIHLTYRDLGTEMATKLLLKGKTDLAVLDWPLTPEQLNQKAEQIPIGLGGIVPVYNIPGVRELLNFTPDVLASIFDGRISRWDDARIRTDNPGASLPAALINVVHRRDSCGATLILTSLLASTPGWHAGAGLSVQWPRASVGAVGGEDLLQVVQNTINSIGYVDYSLAVAEHAEFGTVKNAAGYFVRAGIGSFEAAIGQEIPERAIDIAINVTHAASTGAYPLSYLKWLTVSIQSNRIHLEALSKFLEWVTHDGQETLSLAGYAPLPPPLAARARQTVSRIAPPV